MLHGNFDEQITSGEVTILIHKTIIMKYLLYSQSYGQNITIRSIISHFLYKH